MVLQSITALPLEFKNSFVLEKCLPPKNPVCADKGEGCGLSNIRCLLLSINEFLDRAYAPHRRKTTSFKCVEMSSIILLVNFLI